MARTFSAQVRASTAKTRRRMKAVRDEAVQMTLEQAQRPVAQGGRMRVDTAALRNSLVTEAAGVVAQGPDAYTLVIAQAPVGESIAAAWTAEYARHREFGARGQPPDFFARGAAQNWQQNVDAAVARLP